MYEVAASKRQLVLSNHDHENTYAILPYNFNFDFNIILPSTPKFSKWSLFFRFSNQSFECIYNLSVCSVTAIFFVLRNKYVKRDTPLCTTEKFVKI